MIMMRQWWVSDESIDELLKINDESVMSRWKLMIRRWFGSELMLSQCLSEVHGSLDTKEEFSLNLLSQPYISGDLHSVECALVF